MGIPFQIDEYERNLIFNLIVQEKCIDKFGKMDDIFKAAEDINTVVWLAKEMLNQDAEIWNKRNPDKQKPLLDEIDIKQGVDGLGGIIELQKAVSEAILKGLPKEAVKQVEELGEKIAAQRMKKNSENLTKKDQK